MFDLIAFIPSTLTILVAALYVLGYGLKSTELIKDKHIPLILLPIALVFSALMVGVTPVAFLQGICCWGVSIGINQTIKQNKKDD